MLKTSYIKGIWAEIYTIIFLWLKGYKIVKWRMRNYISEIDIIAQKHNSLIAIEVKYRKSVDQGLFAISYQQQQKIRKAFELFYVSQKNNYKTIRCDVCIVNHLFQIKHLKNMF